GAVSVIPVVLRLPTPVREWYLGWLEREHPGLLPRYRALYAHGPLADAAYRERVAAHVRALAEMYGIGRSARRWRRRRSPARQLALVWAGRRPSRGGMAQESPVRFATSATVRYGIVTAPPSVSMAAPTSASTCARRSAGSRVSRPVVGR